MYFKQRRIIPFIVLLMLMICGGVMLASKCHVFRVTGRNPVSKLSSSKHYNSLAKYRNSHQISFYTEKDSLQKISYFHSPGQNNALVSHLRHSTDNVSTDISQINIPKVNQVYLPLPYNRRMQKLLNAFKIDGRIISYDMPPFGIIFEDGTAMLLWQWRAESILHQLIYDQGLAPKNEYRQPVPVISGNFRGRNLVFSLAYEDSISTLTLHELLGYIDYKNEFSPLSDNDAVIISKIKAMPYLDDICLFGNGESNYATIPYRGRKSWHLSILDLASGQLVGDLESPSRNERWIALRQTIRSIDIALADRSSGKSTIYRYDLERGSKTIVMQLSGIVEDAWENEHKELFLLTNKQILKLDKDAKIRSRVSVKNSSHLFPNPWKQDRNVIMAWDNLHKRLSLWDEDLQLLAKIDARELIGKLLTCELTKVPNSHGKKYNLYLLTEDNGTKLSSVRSIMLEELPEGWAANAWFRIKSLVGDLLSLIKNYIKHHPLWSFIYLMLGLLVITITSFLTRQLMKNKLNDIGSLIPIPNNDKEHLHQILNLLKKPSLTTAAILNIDIVDFSKLVAKYNHDPEFLRRILMHFFHRFIDEASKNTGTISKIMGDGIIAVFGWPSIGKLYVNEPRKNLNDALRTAQSMLKEPLTIEGITINFRMGLTIGDIFVGYYGNSLRRDYMAMGNALDISEAIQKSAHPNSLFVDGNAVEACAKYDVPISFVAQGQITYHDLSFETYQAMWS